MASALTLRNRGSITIRAAWVALGLGLVGCAQDTGVQPLGILGFSGNGGAPAAGAPAGGSPGASGTFAMAGNATSGAGGQPFGSGGQPFGSADTFSMAGTGGDAGMTGGGGTGGGAGAGGSSGTPGTGGSGGNSSAGAGGTPATAKCGDHAIPARSQWVASASAECSPTCADPTGPFPASKAIDGDPNTRFSSGKAQSGDEYFQIDLGALATLNQLSINTVPAGDFTQHYQVKAAASADGLAAAPILADAAGAAGTIDISLNQTVNAQVVRIYQTGTTSSWWSINEISVGCQ